MGKLRWYKRDPEAALNGMAVLTLAERGAYNSLIDLLYAQDGDVPDDDVTVARIIRCHWREWRTLKERLIAKGKVKVVDGKLTAKRVAETLAEASRPHHNPGKSAAGSRHNSKKPNAINEKRPTEKEEEKESKNAVAATARARDPLISKHAFELADRIAVLCGHDLQFVPPAWHGAPMRVQAWLTQGWKPEIILIAVERSVAKRKTGPPINSVHFFEAAITEEHARQSRPLPTVKELPGEIIEVRHGENRNGGGQRSGRGGKSHSTLALEYARRAADAGGPGGGQPHPGAGVVELDSGERPARGPATVDGT